jgi:hypothetical protein
MKTKLIVTILLLLFVAVSLVALFMKGTGKPELERAAESSAERNAERGTTEAAEMTEGDTKIVVYYFHGNARCKTCLTIEMYALEAIETGFPEELKAGSIDFLPVNLELAENEHFIDDFKLAARTVVLERVVDGKREDYLNLHRVWELVRDKEAYIEYFQDEMSRFISRES